MIAPKNRAALLEEIAAQIGWGASADDVENVAKELEAQGVSFVPTALLTPTQIAANPYAPKGH